MRAFICDRCADAYTDRPSATVLPRDSEERLHLCEECDGEFEAFLSESRIDLDMICYYLAKRRLLAFPPADALENLYTSNGRSWVPRSEIHARHGYYRGKFDEAEYSISLLRSSGIDVIERAQSYESANDMNLDGRDLGAPDEKHIDMYKIGSYPAYVLQEEIDASV